MNLGRHLHKSVNLSWSLTPLNVTCNQECSEEQRPVEVIIKIRQSPGLIKQCADRQQEFKISITTLTGTTFFVTAVSSDTIEYVKNKI